jgi:hypothetical protein
VQAEIAGFAHRGQVGVITELSLTRSNPSTAFDAQQVPDREFDIAVPAEDTGAMVTVEYSGLLRRLDLSQGCKGLWPLATLGLRRVVQVPSAFCALENVLTVGAVTAALLNPQSGHA